MLYWIPLQCNIDSMAPTRTSRVYTISLPPELAQKAEALAKRDSRTMSELFREAFRTYYAQQSRKTLEEIGEYANGRNPGYTEADVPRLIQEVRSETPARRHTRTRQ
jgi:CopG family transcriptional regulator/antitoxin EndoAI